MSEIIYVKLVRLDNNELWLFKETPQGLKPHHAVKDILELEPESVAYEDKEMMVVS